jgi:hypothetical protein
MTDLGDATEAFTAEEEARLFDRRKGGDRALVLSGFALAAIAAIFPWYVFFNQESFGVNPMQWGDTRDLPETGGRPVVSVSPLAIPDEKDGSLPSPIPYDTITTATVGDASELERKASPNIASPVDQAFPGTPRYQLLHVANGRALIEDENGMYMVQVGSALPDNSTLDTLEQRDGKWVIITSRGEVLSE